jgi:hypothetical protein
MSIESLVEPPILIYDNTCSPCWKYAKIARRLSRGRIRLLGHYDNSEDLKRVKEAVFPAGYDPTSMSWLINENGAHGGRAWVLPMAKEILLGMLFAGNRNTKKRDGEKFDENSQSIVCARNQSSFERWSMFLKNSKRFTFE